MYRSVSTNKVADDYYRNNNYYDSSPKVSPDLRALSLEADELPLYETFSDAAKKERARFKLAENAIHLIPLVLLLCAFVLWFFSNPDVDVSVKGNIIAARIDGLSIEGDVDIHDTDQTGTLPGLELGDLDFARQDDEDHKDSISEKKSL
ncbi:hypothetical protein RJ639_041413 [Escallonia herrerae]|uniref:Transmembrane protein n=1 Tax=Escallonia herrerae TaxID=1293975 RepID=A0AA89BB87_9ASTE|nr:hypothetical protein RJ639_041413 [Escallonia herrerae]